MSIDYVALKTAMMAAGFSPSSGTNWLVSDSQQYVQYCHQHWPVTIEQALMGLAYPGALPTGFPGIIPRTLSSIAVTGQATTAAGLTTQLTATGTYTDAPTTGDLTSTATWVSSNPSVATVSSTGLLTAVAVGTANITASFGGITSPAFAETVSAAVIVSIAITGTNSTTPTGTSQLTATATLSDTSTENVSSTATWVSSAPSIATVSSTGLVTGVAAGTTNITAAQGGVTSPADVFTVT